MHSSGHKIFLKRINTILNGGFLSSNKKNGYELRKNNSVLDKGFLLIFLLLDVTISN